MEIAVVCEWPVFDVVLRDEKLYPASSPVFPVALKAVINPFTHTEAIYRELAKVFKPEDVVAFASKYGVPAPGRSLRKFAVEGVPASRVLGEAKLVRKVLWLLDAVQREDLQGICRRLKGVKRPEGKRFGYTLPTGLLPPQGREDWVLPFGLLEESEAPTSGTWKEHARLVAWGWVQRRVKGATVDVSFGKPVIRANWTQAVYLRLARDFLQTEGKVCPNCGIWFPRQGKKKFCSPSCEASYNMRKLRRERKRLAREQAKVSWENHGS